MKKQGFEIDDFQEVWKVYGLLCGIRMGFSSMNGYVQLPEPFKSRKLLDDDINVSVHGGLTWGMDDQGWVGFDTGHSNDIWLPDDPEQETQMQKAEKLLKEKGFDLSLPLYGDEIIWTTEKVKEETERLAANLVKWMKENPDFESTESSTERRERMRKKLREWRLNNKEKD